VVAVEAVVGNEDDGGVGVGVGEEGAEHLVVELVGGVYDMAEALEFFLREVGQAGGVAVDEVVADVVDRRVEDGETIPRVVFEDVGGCDVDAGGLGETSDEQFEGGLGGGRELAPLKASSI
jgi:hypothetical protein